MRVCECEYASASASTNPRTSQCVCEATTSLSPVCAMKSDYVNISRTREASARFITNIKTVIIVMIIIVTAVISNTIFID